MILALFVVCLLCAAIPTLLFSSNLRWFKPAPQGAARQLPAISVLIPARDEESTIRASVESVLANKDVDLECVVLDDQSSDNTAAIVSELARRDSRVRLETAPPLPPGWCGKQHACFVLSQHATKPLLCFVDADVRLAPDALARMADFRHRSESPLISGFPFQVTETWMERLLLPLIHFVLLGFLPISRMRASTEPAYAAACGQLIMVQSDSYAQTGGHAAIRASLHDGIQLPRLFRRHNLRTDVFDATDLAKCRMYQNARQVWEGLAKNATEGIATPAKIVPISAVLVLGQVAPFVIAFWYPVFLLIAIVAWLPRWLGVARFGHSWQGAALHPIGIAVLLAIQWYALGRKWLGKPAGWKNREYVPN